VQHVTSFHSSAVQPDEINAIMGDYLALERARVYRRLFVTRFGLLALVVAILGAGLHWLSPFASWSSAGVCLVVPAWAWVAELQCDRRLARRLEDGPGRKAIKSP